MPRPGISTSGAAATGAWARPVAIGLAHALGCVAVVAGFAWWLAGGAHETAVADLLVHASGLAALLWAYVGLLTGLLAGTSLTRRRAGRGTGSVRSRRGRASVRPALVTVHRQLNLAVIALTLLHALLYALGTPGGTLAGSLIPGVEPVRGFAVGLGIVGLYLAVLLGPSYYLRARIGRRTWLVAHQLAVISYAVALWHALVLGPTLRLTGGARLAVGLLQFPLLALMALRLLRPMRAADDLRWVHRRGRFTGWRHASLRLAVAWGLLITGTLVLALALLAVDPGQSG